MLKRLAFLLLAVVLSLTPLSCTDTDTQAGPPPASETEETLPNEEKLGYTGGNLGAGGLMACGEDGYIYYRSEADHWALYKARPDGTEKQKLTDDKASNINVMDGWVYYTNFADDFSLYRQKSDGTGRQKLSPAYCSELYVTEKQIIAGIRNGQNGREIITMRHDGSNVTTILPEAALKYYYDGFVYYTDGNLFLWKYNLDTGEHTQLTDVYSTYISVDDSGVYYWRPDENAFHHIAPDGNDRLLIKNGDCYNYCDGNVYYMKLGYDNYNFFRYDTRTGSEEQLTAFTGQLWNSRGEIMEGVNIYNPGDLFDDDDELYFSDNATSVYILDGRPFFRGTLRQCLLETDGTRVDCLFTVDDEQKTVVWD